MTRVLLYAVGFSCLLGASQQAPGQPPRSAAQPWPFRTGGEIFSLPCFDERYMYFGACDGNFYCLNKQTAVLRWKHEGFHRVDSNPVVYGDTVVFAAHGDRMYALKRASGAVLWKKAFQGIGYRNPKVLNENLLITGLNQLLILNPTNGEIIDRHRFQGSGYDSSWNSEALVVVVNSDISFNNYTGKGAIVCFKHSVDKPLWNTPLGGACLGIIASDDEQCYVGARDGRFYAIKMEDGTVAWEIDCTTFFRDGGRVWADGHVLDTGSRVVFSVSHRNIGAPSVLVSADKKTGKVVWSVENAKKIEGRFVATESSVLAATQDRLLLVVKISDGTLQNVFLLPEKDRGEFAGVALDRGHVFVVGADAHVWRIALEQLIPGPKGQEGRKTSNN